MTTKPCLVAALTAALTCTSISAGAIPYTDQASFLADLPGPAITLDFDNPALLGTTIASGTTLDGISFNYDFGGVLMAVTDGDQFGGGGPWDKTSGAQFLGTDDTDILQDGDDFDLTFDAVNAIGMYFISADSLVDDDIMLSAGGGTASLLASSAVGLPDSSNAFFLGIVDDTNSFTSASVTTLGQGAFLYNVDDITTALASPGSAPLPGTLVLMMTVLGGISLLRRPGAAFTRRQRPDQCPSTKYR